MRQSPRELAADIERLEADAPDVAGLITVMSTLQRGGTVERVHGHPDRVRVDGEERRLTENARDRLAGWVL